MAAAGCHYSTEWKGIFHGIIFQNRTIDNCSTFDSVPNRKLLHKIEDYGVPAVHVMVISCHG